MFEGLERLLDKLNNGTKMLLLISEDEAKKIDLDSVCGDKIHHPLLVVSLKRYLLLEDTKNIYNIIINKNKKTDSIFVRREDIRSISERVENTITAKTEKTRQVANLATCPPAKGRDSENTKDGAVNRKDDFLSKEDQNKPNTDIERHQRCRNNNCVYDTKYCKLDPKTCHRSKYPKGVANKKIPSTIMQYIELWNSYEDLRIVKPNTKTCDKVVTTLRKLIRGNLYAGTAYEGKKFTLAEFALSVGRFHQAVTDYHLVPYDKSRIKSVGLAEFIWNPFATKVNSYFLMFLASKPKPLQKREKVMEAVSVKQNGEYETYGRPVEVY